MKVFVYYIGKPKDVHANRIAEDFLGRAAHYAANQMIEINPKKADLPAKHPTARKIYLDPGGRKMDSQAFSEVFRDAEMTGRDLVFLIGGHDGLPTEWRGQADLLLSLSDMTFPHELARAMLAEQIYRATTVLAGHPYHRE